MYTQILAALDGSPRTALVLRQAEQLAVDHHAALHLCRAVSVPLNMPVEAMTLSGVELSELLVEQARRDLDALRGTLTAPLPGDNHVLVGRPAQVVCEIAEALAADLVVIGSHGYGGLDPLLGTTAARIVNHASCSVLVVRPPPAAARHQPG